MSWRTYVDDHLMCDIEGNHLTSATILGHDGSVWAQSASFPKVAPTKYGGSLGTLCQIGTCLGIIASLILGSPSENDPHWGDK